MIVLPAVLLPFTTALGIGLALGWPVIRWLGSWQSDGQPIRKNGPESHKKTKRRTPTAGGLIIFLSFVGSALAWSRSWYEPHLLLLLFIFMGFGCVGFLDDLLKIKSSSHHGLNARLRLFLETLLAVLSVSILCQGSVSRPVSIKASSVLLPLVGRVVDLGFLLYVLFGAFVVVGSANAVNLTDGLDGLATKTSLVALLTFVAVALSFSSSPCFDAVPLLVAISALLGALFAFLWFNRYPAKVFMGDTGSLAIGGSLGLLSLMLKQELLWVLIGGVFVVETISVILQVVSYKTRGRRLFLMAPIHHHFEKLGWSELKIVHCFVWAAVCLNLLALAVFFTCGSPR